MPELWKFTRSADEVTSVVTIRISEAEVRSSLENAEQGVVPLSFTVVTDWFSDLCREWFEPGNPGDRDLTFNVWGDPEAAQRAEVEERAEGLNG